MDLLVSFGMSIKKSNMFFYELIHGFYIGVYKNKDVYLLSYQKGILIYDNHNSGCVDDNCMKRKTLKTDL